MIWSVYTPAQLIAVVRANTPPAVGAEQDLASQVTDLWNAGVNVLTDAANLPAYVVVKGARVVANGFSEAWAAAVSTGSTAAAGAIEELGTRFGSTARRVLTDIGAGASQVGSAWWDVWGPPLLVGLGAVLLVLGGLGLLATTAGGQSVLTGVGRAAPALLVR